VRVEEPKMRNYDWRATEEYCRRDSTHIEKDEDDASMKRMKSL